jgi:hypothetical protein
MEVVADLEDQVVLAELAVTAEEDKDITSLVIMVLADLAVLMVPAVIPDLVEVQMLDLVVPVVPEEKAELEVPEEMAVHLETLVQTETAELLETADLLGTQEQTETVLMVLEDQVVLVEVVAKAALAVEQLDTISTTVVQ